MKHLKTAGIMGQLDLEPEEILQVAQALSGLQAHLKGCPNNCGRYYLRFAGGYERLTDEHLDQLLDKFNKLGNFLRLNWNLENDGHEVAKEPIVCLP